MMGRDLRHHGFAMHYPAGALTDGRVVGTALHGPNACLGM